jgi:hypothetical protein
VSITNYVYKKLRSCVTVNYSHTEILDYRRLHLLHEDHVNQRSQENKFYIAEKPIRGEWQCWMCFFFVLICLSLPFSADSPYTRTVAVITSYLRVSVLEPGLEQWTKEQRNRSTDSLSVLEATGRTLNKGKWLEQHYMSYLCGDWFICRNTVMCTEFLCAPRVTPKLIFPPLKPPLHCQHRSNVTKIRHTDNFASKWSINFL